MKEWCRVFGLLLRKNFLIRLRHWKLTLFLQVLLPVLLFVLIQAVRDFNSVPPKVVKTDTYYPLQSKDALVNLIKRSLTTIYFVPNDTSTTKFMNLTKNCLKYESRYCYIFCLLLYYFK